MNLSDKIKNLRIQKGISQRELGRRIGMSGQMISKIEGNRTTPSLETLVKIADAFEVHASTLVPEGYLSQNLNLDFLSSDKSLDEYKDLRNQAIAYDFIKYVTLDDATMKDKGYPTPLLPKDIVESFKQISCSLGLFKLYEMNYDDTLNMLYSDEFHSLMNLLSLKYTSKDSDK